MCANPIAIPGLTSYILDQLDTIPDKSGCHSSRLEPSLTLLKKPQSTLESLPIDIISIITSFLPTSTVLRLHRTSKILSSKTLLTQFFFRDRLISGCLVPHLWDLDPQACHDKDTKGGPWDWRSLAEKLSRPDRILQAALGKSLAGRERDEFATGFEEESRGVTEFGDAPIGFRNRCRMVRIVRDVERMDEIEASEMVVHGVKMRRLGLLFA